MTGRRPRTVRYLAAAMAGTVLATAAAVPAFAHTKITVQPAQAGAANAVVDVNAEAESDTAGVAKVQVFLPEGITPADVTLLSAPTGWKLTTQADSYTVAGKALSVGRNAEHKVRVRQLPMTDTVSFKILQTYSDNRTDRWIEIPSAANPEPANPAPTVKLAAAAQPTTPPSSAVAATPSAAAPNSAPVAAAPPSSSGPVVAQEPAAQQDDTSSNAWWWILALVAALVVGGGIVAVLRRRSRAT